MYIKKALAYNQVYLIPKMGVLDSRSEADLSVNFLGRKFKAPWLPANMACVVNLDICKWLSENDYFYIMHRFGDTLEFVRKANKEGWKTISISVGVKEEDREMLKQIVKEYLQVDFICIDVAHGHHTLVKEMIEFIKSGMYNSVYYPPKIIAGNVATPEAVGDLAKWGADAVKCGIGGGAACSTKVQTSFHIPMFTCVQHCCANSSIPTILDGGVREPGDIARALAAARFSHSTPSLVMAGSIFAACKDAPGENVYTERLWVSGDGTTTMAVKDVLSAKKYHGSASEHQKGEKKHVEGFQVELPCNGMTYEEYYQHLTEALSSAVSYAGGKDLQAFSNVGWVEV